MTLQELRADALHAVKSMDDVMALADTEKRSLTEDEKSRYDALETRYNELNAQIAGIEETEKKREENKRRLEQLSQPEKRQSPAMQPQGSDKPVIEFTRYGSLKAFKGQGADERAYRAGQWLRASLFGDQRAAQFCRDNGLECRAIGEGSNTSGGALVPIEMSRAIIDLREQYGVFRRLAKVWPMQSDTLNIPRRTSGVTAYFVNENSEVTASDAAWDIVELVARKLAALTKVSTEIAEDAVINLADTVAQEIAYAFAVKEDACGFNGDGTSTYSNIQGLTYLLREAASNAGGINATAGHDTFAEVDAADLTALMSKLPLYARPNARWICSSTFYDAVFSRLAVASGGNTIQSVSGAFSPSYLGFPIEVSQSMPASPTDTNVMVLFGDLSLSSAFGSRRDVRILASDQRYMEYDQIGILGTERFDVVNHNAGTASSAGAVVGLNACTA